MTRSDARELLMQVIYQMEIQNDTSAALKNKIINDIPGTKNQLSYINDIFEKVTENMQVIDAVIDNNSNKWRIGRIPKVDLAILRLAIAEMLYTDDIPSEVSINEAVNLAKKYSTEDSGRFINGVLSKVI